MRPSYDELAHEIETVRAQMLFIELQQREYNRWLKRQSRLLIGIIFGLSLAVLLQTPFIVMSFFD